MAHFQRNQLCGCGLSVDEVWTLAGDAIRSHATRQTCTFAANEQPNLIPIKLTSMNKQRILLTGLSVFLSLSAWSAGTTLTVQTKKTIATVNPDMYGIFFEDINFAADGGLYAELIKNRSFEFPQTLMGWNIFGKVSVQTDGPFDRNPHYVRLTDAGHAHKRTGLENEGFRGIGFKQDAAYRFSVWARA